MDAAIRPKAATTFQEFDGGKLQLGALQERNAKLDKEIRLVCHNGGCSCVPIDL